ncbi:BREX system P-loop protein BrxC [Olsenella uli]|uniref:BREX system P-loop protein BrxC n=1 Tax=Olsenella uli TaxID=133926 RepID=UPI0028F058E9|nr:BREX system P-loop protein BrxC [Olsenella uli]
MIIQHMFEKDIDRAINGVIQVSNDEAIRQELDEYVVTRELRRHFADFFDAYERALDAPTDRVGVWISGYFGSGKSHFLKMLSYLLENPEVDGRRAIDYFDGKVDDPMVVEQMRRASSVETEAILFNIDDMGGGWKEGAYSETALLRTFARVFYEHLGFFGLDLKLARFERMVDLKGGTERFREAYERIAGVPWVEERDAYGFHSMEIAEAAEEALGLSADDVESWIDNEVMVTLSPVDFVADVKAYVERRKAERGGRFRLLFMADEMGQFIGSNVSRMLNLQTIVERLGSECRGDVWVAVTSQEALDEMRTIVENDFSKIQGRFATRLSLSSSSVDEVIKRRVLAKKPEMASELRAEYGAKSAVLKNLFSFERSVGDLVGYTGAVDFMESYPFVGYQFALMPDVLNQIRRHGYSGKHISTGERSMLSAFQESAQAVEGREDGTLVPFWRFFDTLERQLDHGIKQVFERARQQAARGQGLEEWDVSVLKALYLVVYLPEAQLPTTVANVAILMADDIDADTLALKEHVKASLERLIAQNYVTRDGQRYTFLTDQEQDVEREIRATQIDSADVLERIKGVVYDGVYTNVKLCRGANDFPVDRYVDDSIHGRFQNGMRLDLITVAHELSEASDIELGMRSAEQALVVLSSGGDYYDLVQGAAKVRKYAQGINREGLPEEKRRFVERKQRQANEDMRAARVLIEDAIVAARVAVAGQVVAVPAASAKAKLDSVLERLAAAVFTKAELVNAPLSSDAQLGQALAGTTQQTLDPADAPNAGACAEVMRYLKAQDRTHQQVSFGDLQRHFQERPYGWRQDDVSLVLATLVGQQRASVTYAGAPVAARDPKLRGMLTNQSNFDKLGVRVRRGVAQHLVTGTKSLLREIDPTAQVPADEDGLVAAVADSLGRVREHCEALSRRYAVGRAYPGECEVRAVRDAVDGLLFGSREPEAFLRQLSIQGDDLVDALEDMSAVESFFKSQVAIFDQGTATARRLRSEGTYFEGDPVVTGALEKIEAILQMPSPYARVHELTGLCREADAAYDEVVRGMRTRMLERLAATLAEVETYAESQKSKAGVEVGSIARDARLYAKDKRLAIEHEESCTRLDAIGSQVAAWAEQQYRKVDEAVRRAAQAKVDKAGVRMTVQPKFQPKTKVLRRADVCPTRLLGSEEEVDAYVSDIRDKLVAALRESGSVRLG